MPFLKPKECVTQSTLALPGNGEYEKMVWTMRDAMVKMRGVEQESGCLVLESFQTGNFGQANLSYEMQKRKDCLTCETLVTDCKYVAKAGDALRQGLICYI